jgi:hypothetical protein
MNERMAVYHPLRRRRANADAIAAVSTILLLALPGVAHASLLSGEALDTAANIVAWIALIVVPVALITAFWMVHILPEKIAEKRRHPQLAAIKTLCLLSLAFGGLLWPLAWLWAYTKPVLHKMAYGTDQEDHGHGGDALTPLHDARTDVPPGTETAAPASRAELQRQVEVLTQRLAELEARLGPATAPPAPGPAE